MKNAKLQVFLFTILLAVQTIHANDSIENDEPKPNQTWAQAAWDKAYKNRYALGTGAALLGTVAGAYLYSNELAALYDSFSPEKKKEVTAKITQEIQNSEANIEAKQEMLDKKLAQLKKTENKHLHSKKEEMKHEAAIAQLEKEIAGEQEAVENKQGWRNWIKSRFYTEETDPLTKQHEAEMAESEDAWKNTPAVNDVEARLRAIQTIDPELVKAEYIKKYGTRYGIQRFEKEKAYNDVVAAATFMGLTSALHAPAASLEFTNSILSDMGPFLRGPLQGTMVTAYAFGQLDNTYANMKEQAYNNQVTK